MLEPGKLALKRYEGNPILEPVKEHRWESGFVFNCGVIRLNEKIHILYRAQENKTGISTIGYASTYDGFDIEERLPKPVFTPCPDSGFECFGVEDPRLTPVDDTIFMCYTAFGKISGKKDIPVPQIGITSIHIDDFLAKKWNWKKRIYPFPRVSNKDAAILPEKVNGKYVLIHRISPHIWIGYSDDLENWFGNKIIMSPESDWEYLRIGLGSQPIKTEKGWLVVYHGIDRDCVYRLGFVFLDLDDPEKIIYRSRNPIFEPVERFELFGNVPDVVFTCGAVIQDDRLFVYYGGADQVIGVATIDMNNILNAW
ncbi:MAG: glycosidase [Candidatus Eremiobacteraeota bacterium]|nr:glycosidase [Candidatus Eremiobacteraeota bacterium]